MCFVHFDFEMCFAPQRRTLFPLTSKLPKAFRARQILTLLTWKCASHCFAPQRRALFRHLNFETWSENGVCFVHFDLECASRHNGIHFFDILTCKSAPILVCFAHFLTSKCASRHNGVQLFISHLASWLRTRRFSEVIFRPSGATNHWKNTANRDFPTVTFLYFLRTASSFLLLSDLLSSSLLLSDSSHLCFSNCPYCRKFHF